MKSLIEYSGLLILIFGFNILVAQQTLTIIPNPFSGNPSPEQFWKVQVINNSGEAVKAYLSCTVTAQQGRLIYKGVSDLLTFQSGSQSIKLSEVGLSQEWLSPILTIQSQREQQEMPSYEVCLEAISQKGENLGESCQQHDAAFKTPPYLVYPFDEEKLQISRPMFSWTPPAPIEAGAPVHYTLQLVEKHPFQTAEIAIRSNPSWFIQENIPSTVLPYPVAAQELDEEKKYAWQVMAYQQGRFLGRTEVWMFSFAQEFEEEEEDNRPFVDIRKQKGAGSYIALGSVKFQFDREYGKDLPLCFHIYDQKRNKIRLEEGQLEQVGKGLNVIDFRENYTLEDGAHYTLEVISPKKELYKMRFVYVAK